MPVLPILTAIIGLAGASLEPSWGDTLRATPSLVAQEVEDSTVGAATADRRAVVATPVAARARVGIATAPLDTPTTRRRAVAVSDWYGRRMLVHRV
ncbi:MAG TPA: hypothetical protein VEA99_08680, partial [Gemmatimonadaceae bacterium]|nr:hypothetical protein [Gemmatimonadaceae bacterium]